MRNDETEYLRRRAEAEALLALEASKSKVAAIHNELAFAYAQRLDALHREDGAERC